MFFENSLQDGIAQALQEQKLVACFVTDDIGESLRWEAWLKNDDQLRQKLGATTVLLKLTAGGQEAGYLAAFCPIDSVPAFIVIRNGVPTAHLKANLEESEFKDALIEALEGGNSKDSVSTSNTASQSAIQEESVTQTSRPSDISALTSANHTASQSASIPASTISDEQKEKAKRAAQIKKEQHDALAERRRVLAQIESDKKERQAREKEREKARKQLLREEQEQKAKETKQAKDFARRNAKECALKIRTFDGATISSIFPSDQSLHKHVRSWIEETLEDLKDPYEFKWLLTPMPNRRISASEEEDTLVSLGLTPSATLVMMPIRDYSTAYSENWPGVIGSTMSLGQSIVSSGYGIVSGGLSMASNAVGSLMGRTEPIKEAEKNQSSTEATGSSRVSTLADRRRNLEDQQLYNGNQLNFERRKDEDDTVKDE